MEVLQHHGEQVLARKALHHPAGVGRHGHRVGVVDHQRLDLRAEGGAGLAQQVVAQLHHVQRARRAPGQQIGALQRRALHGEVAGAGHQQAARALAPGAGERRQAGDGAHRVGAAVRALHPVVQPDRRRPRGAPVARQAADLRGRHAADGGGALGREGQRPLAQLWPAVRVALQVVVVQPVVLDQLVHQRQGQRRVGAGQQLHVLVALLGRFGAAWVDAHQARALALGFLRPAPEVQVAGNRVAAPDEDQPALGEELGLHAHLGAQRVDQPFDAGRRADGALQARGAQAVEEAVVHALALHQAHGAGKAVGQDGFGLARGNRRQARGDVLQRLVPGHRCKLAAALGAGALERGEDALGVVRALGVTRDLGAQHAARGRVRGVALHAHGAPVLHGGQQRAGIRAVVGTGAAHGGHAGGAGGVGAHEGDRGHGRQAGKGGSRATPRPKARPAAAPRGGRPGLACGTRFHHERPPRVRRAPALRRARHKSAAGAGSPARG